MSIIRDKLVYLLRKVLLFCSKIRHSHIRMICSIIFAYFIVDYIFIRNIAKNIKNNNEVSIISILGDTVKEAKETATILKRLIQASGVSDLQAEYVKHPKMKNFSAFSDIILKREDLSISIPKFPGILLPSCGAKIESKIVMVDAKGSILHNENFSFTLGNFELPIGLEIAMQKVKTGARYDLVLPIKDLYFGEKPIDELKSLKPTKYTKFVTYQTIIQKIDKFSTVNSFEPRIFYLTKGAGLPVICGSSVDFIIHVSDINNKKIYEKKYISNINSLDIPSGIEFILRSLKEGDRVSVLLNKSWLKYDKKSKIKFPNDDYLILDITINDVKHPQEAFFINKPEMEIATKMVR